MKLPIDFAFSQANLQDFMDCEYRFLLKHIRKLEWPAVESEPARLHEEKMELGYQFHRMVQQYFSGVDPEILQGTIDNTDLSFWWQSFVTLQASQFSGTSRPELLISVPFHGYRLLAKFDLLVLDDAPTAKIFDWKTSQVKPNRSNLHKKIQTMVYPLVLFLGHTGFQPAINLSPDKIEMTYWFPQFPFDPITFSYSQGQFDRDVDLLTGMVDSILAKSESGFNKTDQPQKCAFCRYRSLCNRGKSAGSNTTEESVLSADDLETLSFDAL